MITDPKSCIYAGWVRHRRNGLRPHAFRYRLCMMYIDLAELPDLFDVNPLWSARRPAPAWFRRADYLGPATLPLDEAVRELVKRRLGWEPVGPIRLLTHLRYAGHIFNPVSFYYCFSADGQQVEAIVAEITNTPWGERHAYVLDRRHSEHPSPHFLQWRMPKRFHVSPFMGMDMTYDWRFRQPGEHLNVHMENWRQGDKVFDATLTLKRRPITGLALTRVLAEYPLMTIRVVAGIYWQAFRHWCKGTPFHHHPQTATTD